MTTQQAVVPRNRRPRGQHPRPRDPDGRRRSAKKLPEYLEARDLSLEGELPSLHVREGKGSKPRIVPVHPELSGDVGQGEKLIRASCAAADRWIKAAAARAMELGAIPLGRRV